MLLLLLGKVALGEPFPTQSRGFTSEKAFEIGDLDAINPFNFNVVITIPIGVEYPLSEHLTYRFWLTHNGSVWDYQNVYACPTSYPCGMYTHALPERYGNAGLGWLLSIFGRLFTPADPANDTGLWKYTSADGAEHLFYPSLHEGEPEVAGVLYSRSTSYLRLIVTDPNAPRLEAADGTIYRFDANGILTRAEDRHGNWLNVVVSTSRWDLSDSHGRSHTVRFSPEGRATSIELAASGGAKAIYELTYQPATIQRGCGHDDPDPDWGTTTSVQLLTSVKLPGQQGSFAMPLSDYHTGPSCETSGRLKRVTLPTLGRIGWEYQGMTFPLEQATQTGGPEGYTIYAWRGNVTGVKKRVLYDAAGGVLGSWSYESTLDSPLDPQESRELRNRITTPLGHYTDHFFSVYAGTAASPPWDWREFGLPLSKHEADATGQKFLSTRVYDSSNTLLRSTYVRYERDPDAELPGTITEASNRNRRLVSTRTVYHDDVDGQGNARVADTNFSDFDGYGHYRRTDTGGNFGSGDVRSTFRRYNAARGTYLQPGFQPLAASDAWVLDTFDLAWEQEGGQVAIRSFDVDLGTGWVRRERVHRSTATAPPSAPTDGTSSTDVVIERLHDGGGNLASERYHGSDTQPLCGSGSCSGPLSALALPQPPAYRIDHTTSAGTRASSTYVKANGSAMGFKVLDQTIDVSTGLVATSRDTAGVTVDYTYDELGRPRFVKPRTGHDGWTEYLYTPASSPSSLAKVNVLQRTNGQSTGIALAETVIKFDAQGRVTQEQERLPDGTTQGTLASREIAYNAAGWRASVSELGNTAKKTTFTGYDPFGRPSTITAADGSVVTSTHVGVRQVARKVKVVTAWTGEVPIESETTTTEVYDRQGRLSQVTEPANSGGSNTTTSYFYDVGNRLRQVRQVTGAGTQNRFFTYDQRGFLLNEDHPEKGATGNGRITYSSYDARGHAGRKVDGPSTLDFVYDRAERLLTVSQPGVGTLKDFGYDSGGGAYGNGKLVTATRYHYHSTNPSNVTVTETNTYGGRGGRLSTRLTQLTSSTASQTFTTSWVYDHLGNVSQISQPTCTISPCDTSTPARTVSYGYSHGRLTSATGSGNVTYASAIGYHSNGALRSIDFGNGVKLAAGLDPDSMGRPASYGTLGASLDWVSGSYHYDGAGNVTRIGSSLFSYDRVSRLVEAAVRVESAAGGLPFSDDFESGDLRCWESGEPLVPGACVSGGTTISQSFAYDGFGNLTSIGGSPGRSIPVSAATNRLTGSAYDAAGNLNSWNGATYEYGPFHELVRMTNGGEDWYYFYTASDERIWRRRIGGNGSHWTVRGLGGEVLRELDFKSSTGWTVVRDYVYRGGALLAAHTDQASPGHLHFFALDHLGTPRLVTDSAKAVVAYHVYAPFGEELTAPNQGSERAKFTGHERDLNSTAGASPTADDLDYMHARFYNPQLGRFLSVDPAARRVALRNPQFWHRYSYAAGNPLKYLDPDGRDVTYANKADQKFFEGAAQRNWQVRAVLDAFAPGTGRDLAIVRGDPGTHRGSGTPLAAVTNAQYREASPDELVRAHDAAGGGAAGTAAAEALLAQGQQLRSATIILGSAATAHDKLHELGHLDQGLRNPGDAIRDSEVAANARTLREYHASASELYAEMFAKNARRNEPIPP